MQKFLSRLLLIAVLLLVPMRYVGADGPALDRTVSFRRQAWRAPAENLKISTDSNLVLIPVTVTDRFNHSVRGLVKEDFRIFDDHKEQQIVSFGNEDIPTSIGIVFDCSRSMEHKLGISKAAVGQFLETANPQDEFFLVEFSDRAQLIQPFTAHAEEIGNRLTFVEAKGATALLDAIILSTREMKNARNPRRALLIISDGNDNNSRHRLREIKTLVKEADMEIFAIGIYLDDGAATTEELTGPELLAGIAEQTGGIAYPVANLDELPEIARSIGTALRDQYVIGYAPRDVPHTGKYRRVEVTLTWRRGSAHLQTSWKHGYYTPAE